jgi:hypothetical protein
VCFFPTTKQHWRHCSSARRFLLHQLSQSTSQPCLNYQLGTKTQYPLEIHSAEQRASTNTASAPCLYCAVQHNTQELQLQLSCQLQHSDCITSVHGQIILETDGTPKQVQPSARTAMLVQSLVGVAKADTQSHKPSSQTPPVPTHANLPHTVPHKIPDSPLPSERLCQLPTEIKAADHCLSFM